MPFKTHPCVFSRLVGMGLCKLSRLMHPLIWYKTGYSRGYLPENRPRLCFQCWEVSSVSSLSIKNKMGFLGYGMFSRSSTRVISGILLWFKMIRTSLCSGNSSRRFKKNTPGTVDLESHISSIQVWISPIWLRFWNLTNFLGQISMFCGIWRNARKQKVDENMPNCTQN